MKRAQRRPSFIIRAIVVGIFVVLSAGLSTAQTSDPLPSWKSGVARQSIVDFVRATTDPASPQFVPVEERIATFDQDGTLWVEQPLPTQGIYCIDRVPALVAAKPELKDVEPFKTVLSGDYAAIAKLPMKDLETLLMATLTGMTADGRGQELARHRERHQMEAILHGAYLPTHAGASSVFAR